MCAAVKFDHRAFEDPTSINPPFFIHPRRPFLGNPGRKFLSCGYQGELTIGSNLQAGPLTVSPAARTFYEMIGLGFGNAVRIEAAIIPSFCH